ncbi:peptidylprolyl isomerase [Arenimonas terrae]|uniref:Peptidyl-prolyl cis-trans isomerase n=1 Tax=Arenimonas terrae TaxID=2546226 RepID=A0A5C4RX28_9GAMM|nr:peptidylprolyl isomerase [Arenimonas terrae]TNJ35267.1 peptidyl-prolyl cis-trans isomerase [Arenimonas terrae]
MPVRPILLFACLLLTPPAFATAVPAPAAPLTPPVVAPAPQRVLMVTSLGEITIELDAAAAPKTVENFLAYARDGHYNGTVFHRVVPGLLVQGGAFTPDLQQKPSRAPVPNEAGNGLSNRRGTIAAARDRGVSDSATAQFFINLADNPHFDRGDGDSAYTAGYAVFGRVLQGLDVVERIAALPTSARGPFPAWVPDTPVVIERVQLLDPLPPPAPSPAEPTEPSTR